MIVVLMTEAKEGVGIFKWLSRDPLGEREGINLYRYVHGNPINLFDPLGLCPCDPAASLSSNYSAVQPIANSLYNANSLENSVLNQMSNNVVGGGVNYFSGNTGASQMASGAAQAYGTTVNGTIYFTNATLIYGATNLAAGIASFIQDLGCALDEATQ